MISPNNHGIKCDHDSARGQHQTTKKTVLYPKWQKKRNVFLKSMAKPRLQCRSVLCSTSLIVAVIQRFPCYLINLRSWGHSPHLRPMWPVSFFFLENSNWCNDMISPKNTVFFTVCFVLFCFFFFFLAQGLLVFMAFLWELWVTMEFYSRNQLSKGHILYNCVASVKFR